MRRTRVVKTESRRQRPGRRRFSTRRVMPGRRCAGVRAVRSSISPYSAHMRGMQALSVYRGVMRLRHRDDGPDNARFQMREKLLSIGDDFWIEDDRGERAYKVDGKAFRLRQTFVLDDGSGNEVARIQERKLSIRDKIAIQRGGDTAATVHKALVGLRDRFAIAV